MSRYGPRDRVTVSTPDIEHVVTMVSRVMRNRFPDLEADVIHATVADAAVELSGAVADVAVLHAGVYRRVAGLLSARSGDPLPRA